MVSMLVKNTKNVSQRTATDKLGHEWLIEIWFMAEIKFGNAPLRNNAAVICLATVSVP